MKYFDHHGGASEDVIMEFNSPFDLGEYLREKLRQYYVPVNFDNLHASNCDYGRMSHGWHHLWVVHIDGYGVAGWADSWWPEEEKK